MILSKGKQGCAVVSLACMKLRCRLLVCYIMHYVFTSELWHLRLLKYFGFVTFYV